MKNNTTVLGCALLLSMGIASPIFAAKSAPSAGMMGGVIGVGAAVVPMKNGDLNGITADYWLSNKIALEGFLGFGTSSFGGGTDALGKPINDSGSAFGLAGSGRFNLINTADTVYFDLMGRLGYTNNNNTHTTLGTASSSTSGTVSLFVGADVEAFVPMWRSISVEASAGLNLLFGSLSSTAPGSTSISESSMFLGGTNSLPLNIAFHYYFR